MSLNTEYNIHHLGAPHSWLPTIQLCLCNFFPQNSSVTHFPLQSCSYKSYSYTCTPEYHRQLVLWNFHRVMTQTNRSSCQQVRIYYWRSQGHLIKWVQVLEEQCRTFQFNIALSLWHFSLLDHVTPMWHVMWWPHGRLSWAWPVAPYTGLPVYNTWTQRPSSSLPLGTRLPLNQSFPCINPPQGYSSSHILHTTSQNTRIYM